jgi:hypothetical protein
VKNDTKANKNPKIQCVHIENATTMSFKFTKVFLSLEFYWVPPLSLIDILQVTSGSFGA